MWQPFGSLGVGAIAGHAIPDDGRLWAAWLTNDVVYTACTRNALAVASLPWRLFRRRRAGSARAPVKSAERARLRAKASASAAIQTADELEELSDHPLLDLIAGPSETRAELGAKKDDAGPERLGGWQLWYMTAIMLDVFGGAYWRIVPGRLGLPAEIRLLPTMYLETLRDDHSRVRAYLYTPPLVEGKQQQIEIDASEMLAFRFPSIEDPWGGRQSPLRSAYSAAQLAMKYGDYQNAIFENRARIDGTFIPKEIISSEEADRAEQLWNQKFGRTGNGRVRVATQPGTFVPTQYSPQDLGELKIAQDALKRVCDAYGLPEALLSKEATYANMSASLHLHALSAVKPRVELLESEINRRLVPMYGDDLIFAADNPVPAEEAVKLQRTQIALQAGIITANEGRAALGFDRIEAEGADELPSDAADAASEVSDEGVESPEAGGAAGEPDVPSQPPMPQTPGQNAPPEAGAAQEPAKLMVDINQRVASGTLERSVAIRLAAMILQTTELDAKSFVGHPTKDVPSQITPVPEQPGVESLPGEKELTAAATAYLEQQRQGLEQLLAAFQGGPAAWPALGAGMPDVATAQAHVRSSTWWGPFGTWMGASSGWSPDQQGLAAAYLLGLFDREQGAAAEMLRDPENALAAQVAKNVADVFGVQAQKLRESMEAAALAAVRRARMLWSGVIAATTMRKVGASIQGLSAAEVSAKAKEIVDEVFADATLRAREIASEELFRTQSIAERASARVSYQIQKVIWVTAGDEKVCPVCGALDGHAEEIDEAFQTALGPMDTPPAHVNCRCRLWYVTISGRLLDVQQRGGEGGAPSSALIL